MAEKRKDRKGRILRDGENQLKDSTRSNYMYMYINYVSDKIGRKKVASIKYSDIKAFYNSLIREKCLTKNTISVTEFYREFCTLLGLEASGNKTGMFRAIQERVYYLYREKKQPLVLAIDEAQYLNYNILRDLKMLLNHSYDSLNCFSLILVGEPYLNHILDKQVHEALRQRITVHYNYEGLSDQEVPDYIYHKLELAGGSRSILEGGAVSAVHGYSEGNARKIDNLMTDALTIGAQQEQQCINAEVIMAAANSQSLI